MDHSNAKERYGAFYNSVRLTVASVLEMGYPELIKGREVLKHTPTMKNGNINRRNVIKGVSNRKTVSVRSSTM